MKTQIEAPRNLSFWRFRSRRPPRRFVRDEDVSSENADYIREVEDVSHGGAILTKWLILGASGVSFQAFTLYSLLVTLYSLLFTL